MNTYKLENLAKDFVVSLAFGAESHSVAILRQNPTIVNTLTMADTVVPSTRTDMWTDEFDIPLRVRKVLNDCFAEQFISKKQLSQAVNARSPAHGETMATLLTKLMISQALSVAQFSAVGGSTSQSMKSLQKYRKILNMLIQDDNAVKLDVNVPNERGQYPLELLSQVASNPHVFRLLSKDYEHISALTSQSVKNKIKNNRTGKKTIEVLNDAQFPKLRAKLTTRDRTDLCSISVIEARRSFFLASETKSPLSVAPIRPRGSYLITYSSNRRIADIMPMLKFASISISLNYNGKWLKIPYDSIYPTFEKITTEQMNRGNKPIR